MASLKHLSNGVSELLIPSNTCIIGSCLILTSDLRNTTANAHYSMLFKKYLSYFISNSLYGYYYVYFRQYLKYFIFVTMAFMTHIGNALYAIIIECFKDFEQYSLYNHILIHARMDKMCILMDIWSILTHWMLCLLLFITKKRQNFSKTMKTLQFRHRIISKNKYMAPQWFQANIFI